MLRFQALSWTVSGLATACGVVMSAGVGFELKTSSLMAWSGLIILLVGLQAFYTVIRPNPVLAGLLGAIAVTSWSLSMIGIVALAGLGTGTPLIDQYLIDMDTAMGLDAAASVAWLSRSDVVVHLMNIAYLSSIPLIFVTLVVLVLTSDQEGAWRFCVCITGLGLACSLVSALFPAIGAFASLSVPHDVLARLPDGAGLYHLPVFEAYREGKTRIIDVMKLDGVVTFPSFHTVMAVATAHAWRTIRGCAIPIALWNGVVVASTILIGGHYFVDLIAAAGLCFVLLRLTRTRLFEAPSSTMMAGSGALPASVGSLTRT